VLAVVSGCQSPLLSMLLSAIAFSPTVKLYRICGGIQHGTTALDGTSLIHGLEVSGARNFPPAPYLLTPICVTRLP